MITTYKPKPALRGYVADMEIVWRPCVGGSAQAGQPEPGTAARQAPARGIVRGPWQATAATIPSDR
jgi:hypothetical protein